MSTGEDESSPSLNARLRPRKSTASTPNPQPRTTRKKEGELVQDRPKRTSTPSKASPIKQNDLSSKSDFFVTPLFLCPYCDRKFNTRQTASKHARRIHLSNSRQDNFIKCIYCSHSDSDSNGIIKHMVDGHPNQYFACLDCHTRFSSTTELAEHKLNVCEKQKPTYRSKLRQKASPGGKQNSRRANVKSPVQNENSQYADERRFAGIVISCELKPTEIHDAADIEEKITTNLILPPSKTLGNTSLENNAVIVLDDLQWNKRIPPNFSFHNTDADQILSRLGVVHRSPRVGESRKDLIRLMDAPNEKFEKCFDTSFYSRVAKNVQENLANYLDGSFNFNPNKETIKTRKSKASVVINTAEGFPILLANEQFSRHLFDGLLPRTLAPKHKWKWDTADSDNKTTVMLLDQTKRDNHVNNCIITLVSNLDIWTQLRMRRKFEEIFKTKPTAKKAEKQNIISMELKEILESRDIPIRSSYAANHEEKQTAPKEESELAAYLGLSPAGNRCEMQPAVLSGEWVRPRAYVCCACGDQTRDARTLTTHISSQHPNAQVQHYEIVGETLLSADILKHLYVPPSQMSNRTRPPRGFRDCTKCKKSITLEDLHQHMLDCAGDTPTVRRKCRYRPFGVRRRRPRIPDNTIRKKMRKDIRSRHRQKVHIRPRPRPRIRTEVGDAETIRKMIADLPAKRNRITPANTLRPRRSILSTKRSVKLRVAEDKKCNKGRTAKLQKPENATKPNDTDNSSTIDEDDQPLKLSAKRTLRRATFNTKEPSTSNGAINKSKKKKRTNEKNSIMRRYSPNFYNIPPDQFQPHSLNFNMFNAMQAQAAYSAHTIPANTPQPILRPSAVHPHMYSQYSPDFNYHQMQMAVEYAQASDNYKRHLKENSRFEEFYRGQINYVHPFGPKSGETLIYERSDTETDVTSQLDIVNLASPLVEEPYALDLRSSPEIVIDEPYSVLNVDENSIQLNEESSLIMPEIIDSSNQVIEDIPPRVIDNISTQVIEDIATRVISDTSTPVIEDIVPPVISDVPTRVIEDTATGLIKNFQVFVNNASRTIEDTFTGVAKDIASGAVKDTATEVINDTSTRAIEDTAIQVMKEISTRVTEDTVAPILEEGAKELINNMYALQTAVDHETSINAAKEDKPTNLIIEQTQQRINIYGAGRSNGRQHGNNDELNIKNGNDRDSKDGKDNNQKSNIVPVSNKPLKHSIASLTSDTEIENAPEPYQHSNLVTTEINKVTTHEPKDRRQKFENESEANTLDKPPLPKTLEISTNSVNTVLKYDIKYQVRQADNLDATSKPGEQLSQPNDISDPAISGDQQRYADLKIDLDKSKLNKSRKGINDCIAMIITKKGLRHNFVPDKNDDVDTQDAEIVDPRSNKNLVANVIYSKVPIICKTQTTNYKHRDRETTISLQSTKLLSQNDFDPNNTLQSAHQRANDNVPVSEDVINTSELHAHEHSSDSENHLYTKQPSSPLPRRLKRKPIKKNTKPNQESTLVYGRNTSPQRLSPSINITQENISDNITTVSSDYATTSEANLDNSPTNESTRIESAPFHSQKLCNEFMSSENPSLRAVKDYDTGSQVKILPRDLSDNTSNIEILRGRQNDIVSIQSEEHLLSQDCRDMNWTRIRPLSRMESPNSNGTTNISNNPLRNNVHIGGSREPQSLYSVESTSTPITTQEETKRSQDMLMTIALKTQDVSEKLEVEQHKLQSQATVDRQYSSRNSEPIINLPVGYSEPGIQTHINLNSASGLQHSNVVNHQSGEYYEQLIPYSRTDANISSTNTTDYSLIYSSNRNDEPVPAHSKSYVQPRDPYSSKVYGKVPAKSTIAPSTEEMAPLDLSFDSITRNDKTLYTLMMKPNDNQVINEKESIKTNTVDNLSNMHTEFQTNMQLIQDERNETSVGLQFSIDSLKENTNAQESTLASNSCVDRDTAYLEPVRSLENQSIYIRQIENSNSTFHSVVPFQHIPNHRQSDMINYQSDLHHPLVSTASAVEYFTNKDVIEKSLNNLNSTVVSIDERTSNSCVDQCSSQSESSNCFSAGTAQQNANVVINSQENGREITFLENKKIARATVKQVGHILPYSNHENKTFTHTYTQVTPSTSDATTINTRYSNLHESNISHIAPLEISTKNTTSVNDQGTQSSEGLMDLMPHVCYPNISYETDYDSDDQDPETVRKIAMIPREIIDIIKRIPEDTRNKLINVLPQYVKKPVGAEYGESSSSHAPEGHINNIKLNQENQSSTDTIKLSTSTISPSSIIPKKRHSPSLSMGGLSYNEPQPTTSALLSPTMPSTSSSYATFSTINELNCLNTAKYNDSTVGRYFVTNHKSLDNVGENTEISVGDAENISKGKEISIVSDTIFVPPIPAQESNIKLLKTKQSNEQTASLRAVRIRTSSARKSFSDEKLNSMIHHSSMSSTEREYLNFRPQNYVSLDQDKTITTQDSDTYEMIHSSNSQSNVVEFSQKAHEQDIAVTFPVSYSDHLPGISSRSEISQSDDVIVQKVIQEKNETFVSVEKEINQDNTLVFSNVSQDNSNFHKMRQCDQQNEMINNSESVKTIRSETGNIEAHHLIHSIKTTPFLDVINTNLTVSNCESHEIFLNNNETKEESMNIKSDGLKPKNKEETLQSERHSLNDVSSKLIDIKENVMSNSLSSPPKCVVVCSDHLTESHKPSKNEVENGDDSEDDLCLALIKQKHNIKSSDNDEKTIESFPRSDVNIVTNVIKTSNHRNKRARRCQKKKFCKNAQKFEVSDDASISSLPRSDINDTENKDIQDNKISKFDGDFIHADNSNNKNNYENDVNKENNSCEIKRNLAISFENIDEKIDHKGEDINLDYNDVPPEENIILTSDNVQDLIEIEPSQEEVDKKHFGKKRQSKEKIKITTTDKSCNTADSGYIECKNDLISSNLDVANNEFISTDIACSRVDNFTNHPLSTNIFGKEKDSTHCITTSPEHKTKSDLQLCSEIRDINAIPLRRSRRGKSMYIDSSHLNDTEHCVQIEDIDKKTPLTMKRLILSRVEKDKKRIHEETTFEKESDLNETSHLTNKSKYTELSDPPRTKKGNPIKRKKSPQSKVKSKKSRSISKLQNEDEGSDTSNIQLDNSNSILRELPNAENTIENKEIQKDEIKNHETSDITTDVFENVTLSSREAISEDERDDDLTNLDIIKSSLGKRKINITKATDTSKSKKTKYPSKKKVSSDFDSDDEKGLLETKQKIENDLVLSQSHASNVSIESQKKETQRVIHLENSKEVYEENTEALQTTISSIATNETRTTCYSRSVSNRRPRSSSVSLKNHVNYDPYDIDFEDMVETTKPIFKKKSDLIGSSLTSKHKQTIKNNSNQPDIIESSSKYVTNANNNIGSNTNNESDSDSSKSDVPLQKYVEEKIYKINKKLIDESEIKHKKESTTQCINESTNTVQKEEKVSNEKLTLESECNDNQCAPADAITVQSEKVLLNTDQNYNTNNNVTVDQIVPKLQKKSRRTPVAHNNFDSERLSNEVDQQLKSDKFMENFGFYSERIPRKSNLLASKKISETFHMISNESDDTFFTYKEKTSKKSSHSENKKKSETESELGAKQDLKMATDDAFNLLVQFPESNIEAAESLTENKSYDTSLTDDEDVDSITAQNILDSEEVRNLENDVITALKEAEDAKAAQNNYMNYHYTNTLDTLTQDSEPKISIEHSDRLGDDLEIIKKSNKSKPIRPPGYKEKMYPDVEEIDMFEDKFDKIKRKRRSQAVAAKQVQIVVETNSSSKSRKQAEKKKPPKNAKKNSQVIVPTKGALKGFDGIKISIPTQDLHMPPNLSPPRIQKKRKKASSKRRKETSVSESSCNEYDEKEKIPLEKDIYEFKDSEDTELFELRPSTVMDRFRSMQNNCTTSKHREREKSKVEHEKEKHKAKEKEKKTKERDLCRDEKYQGLESKHKKREDRRYTEKGSKKDINCTLENNGRHEKYMKPDDKLNVSSSIDTTVLENKSVSNLTRHRNVGNKDRDSVVASTSGFVPDRIDESDYESELSSPEGEFIFYMSDDVNCVCPSDNESEDSDVERSCGRPNCIYKNRNADKNTAIGNIFKNNAVRCEKIETKEPEKPRPDMDQLFDSLFETKPTKTESSKEQPRDQNKVATENNLDIISNIDSNLITNSPQRDVKITYRTEEKTSKDDAWSYCHDDMYSKGKKNMTPLSKSVSDTKKRTHRNPTRSAELKLKEKCAVSANDDISDSSLSQVFIIDDSKDKLEFNNLSENSKEDRNEIDYHTETKVKDATNHRSKKDSDATKNITNTHQTTHKSSADTLSGCDQTEGKIDDSESETQNESAAAKYLRSISPSSAASLQIYTMVSVQSTQTGKSKKQGKNKREDTVPPKNEDEGDLRAIPKSHIRLQRHDVHAITTKMQSSKSIQTERNEGSQCAKYDTDYTDSDDNSPISNKSHDSAAKESRSSGHLNEADNTPLAQTMDSFAAPHSTSRPKDKYSPRKSDEGIGTSHDHSEETLEQDNFDDTGVARQRARRKCTVGKQNVLVEHWSSESEFDGVPARRNSADSIATVSRKKRSRKKEGHHSSKKGHRYSSKGDSKVSMKGGELGVGRGGDEDGECVGRSRAPPGPAMRVRPAVHYWSSDGEDPGGPQPQHGWIVGDSHKKLVTMLAHAKGRKRSSTDKRHHYE